MGFVLINIYWSEIWKSGQIIKNKDGKASYILYMHTYMSVCPGYDWGLSEETRFSFVKAERTPRSERKRRDSFGMFDGYDSCSEDSTSSSSSEDSEDEVVPSMPASLPIIKNNGQVYTYPDGKAGMGQYKNHVLLDLSQM